MVVVGLSAGASCCVPSPLPSPASTFGASPEEPEEPDAPEEPDEPDEPASGTVVSRKGCPAVSAASWMSALCENTSLQSEGRSTQKSSTPREVTPITLPAAS